MSRSGDNRISPQGEQLDTKERETKVPEDGIEYNDALFINALMEFESLLQKSRNLKIRETKLKSSIRRKIISEEEGKKQEEQIKSAKTNISQEGEALYLKYKIESRNTINSSSLIKSIVQLLTRFYEKPEFIGEASFDITTKLDELIKKYSNGNQDFRRSILNITKQVQANIGIDETHEFRIRKCLTQDFGYNDDEIIIKPNGVGKNDSFIVDTPDGRKFVKVCGYSLVRLRTADGGIHPNELFLYKLLEYINFGPKTHFLMQNRASGSSLGVSASVIAHGNYIMTDEVPNLLLDTDEKEQDSINVTAYTKFKNSQNREDAIEISAASLIKGLLSIDDVYPNNGENYGISEQKDRTKFMFVDHTPGVNGVFSGNSLDEETINNYSPRTSMVAASSGKLYGNLTDLSDSHNKWQKHALAGDVHTRVFAGEDGAIPIIDAIQAAQKNINDLINRYPDNFALFTTETGNTIDSKMKLQGYVNKIYQNIENYKTTNYAKLGQGGGNTERS